MKNLTQVVRDEQKLKLMNFIDYLPALIVNIFSVLFSTSIILELRGVVNGWVLVLLSVFIIYFLIQNEVFKVKYIRKVFKGNKNALLPFVGTFVL
jgi:Mn2+/Fe2+ NRAMP family transporter